MLCAAFAPAAVPAALLLSGFAEDFSAPIIGVNLGVLPVLYGSKYLLLDGSPYACIDRMTDRNLKTSSAAAFAYSSPYGTA